MFKIKLPLNPDGTVDFSKVDQNEDYHLFPKLFNSIDDIIQLMDETGKNIPLVRDIIYYLKNNKLKITPTETELYSNEMFDYIYDVFRIPTTGTKDKAVSWLDEYVACNIRNYGFEYFKKESFKNIKSNYDHRVRFEKFIVDNNIILKNGSDGKVKEVNYYTNIQIEENISDFYICKKQEVIDQFWIRSSYYGCPFWVSSEEECYLRVWVFPNRVYIFGTDDASWTLETKNIEESKDFSRFLKCGSPVWNLEYTELIHKDLKFTN